MECRCSPGVWILHEGTNIKYAPRRSFFHSLISLFLSFFYIHNFRLCVCRFFFFFICFYLFFFVFVLFVFYDLISLSYLSLLFCFSFWFSFFLFSCDFSFFFFLVYLVYVFIFGFDLLYSFSFGLSFISFLYNILKVLAFFLCVTFVENSRIHFLFFFFL